MKGPYERLKYTLQRTWECPACSRRLQTDGTSTGNVCNCQLGHPEHQRVSMKLLLDGIRRTRVKQPQPTQTTDTKEVPSESIANPDPSGNDPAERAPNQ